MGKGEVNHHSLDKLDILSSLSFSNSFDRISISTIFRAQEIKA